MNIHNPNQLLDSVLNILLQSGNGANLSSIHKSLKENGFNLTGVIISSIINYLKDEEYVIEGNSFIQKSSSNVPSLKPSEFYRITFRGIVFIQNGGYQQLERTSNKNSERLKRVEIRINRLNILVAIGTIGILILEITKWIFQLISKC